MGVRITGERNSQALSALLISVRLLSASGECPVSQCSKERNGPMERGDYRQMRWLGVPRPRVGCFEVLAVCFPFGLQSGASRHKAHP